MNMRDGGRRKIICQAPPGALARSHFNHDGTEKVRWPNRTSAQYVVDLHDLRRARRGQPPKIKQAYYCGHCAGWHVGRPPAQQWYHTMPERHPELLCELGVRAVAIMWGENSTRPSKQRWKVSRSKAA